MAKQKKLTVAELTGKDLFWYQELMAYRDQLCEKMQNTSREVRNRDQATKCGAATHMADVSSDIAQHEMSLRMLTEDDNVLKLIDDAVERLLEGKFGQCQSCKQMIPEGRLKIRPYAVYCVKCKEIIEKEAQN